MQRRTFLTLSGVTSLYLLTGCGSESARQVDDNGIKRNTSQEFTDEERVNIDRLISSEYNSYVTYDKTIDGDIVLDFSSCDGEPGSGLIDNCNYAVSIEDKHFTCPVELEDGDCPLEPDEKVYNVGFKENNIYIYFPRKTKKYSMEWIEESTVIFTNKEEGCSSTLEFTFDDVEKRDNHPCVFRE